MHFPLVSEHILFFFNVVGNSLFLVTGARNVILLKPVLYPFQIIYKITITRIHTYTCKNSLIAAAAAAAVCVPVCACLSLCTCT